MNNSPFDELGHLVSKDTKLKDTGSLSDYVQRQAQFTRILLWNVLCHRSVSEAFVSAENATKYSSNSHGYQIRSEINAHLTGNQDAREKFGLAEIKTLDPKWRELLRHDEILYLQHKKNLLFRRRPLAEFFNELELQQPRRILPSLFHQDVLVQFFHKLLA